MNNLIPIYNRARTKTVNNINDNEFMQKQENERYRGLQIPSQLNAPVNKENYAAEINPLHKSILFKGREDRDSRKIDINDAYLYINKYADMYKSRYFKYDKLVYYQNTNLDNGLYNVMIGQEKEGTDEVNLSSQDSINLMKKSDTSYNREVGLYQANPMLDILRSLKTK